MAQDLPDLFEGSAVLKHPASQGAAQEVRALQGRIDSRACQCPPNNAADGRRGFEAPVRGYCANETHAASRTTGARPADRLPERSRLLRSGAAPPVAALCRTGSPAPCPSRCLPASGWPLRRRAGPAAPAAGGWRGPAGRRPYCGRSFPEPTPPPRGGSDFGSSCKRQFVTEGIAPARSTAMSPRWCRWRRKLRNAVASPLAWERVFA